MKRLVSIITILAMLALWIPFISIPATALSDGNFEYRFINGDAEVEITKYTGSSASVYLPEIIAGKPVTSVGSEAFRGANMMWLDLGNTLKNIGDYAFAGCTQLMKVEIPDSVTTLGKHAFGHDYTQGFDCIFLKTLKIGNGIKEIPECAFRGCVGLEVVTFGNSIESIGLSAFKMCESLKEIDLPDSVKFIGDEAFSGTAIRKADLGNSLLTIGNGAFNGCGVLESITVPDSVTELQGACTFYRCFSLKTATLGNGIKEIPYAAFADCSSLESISIGDNVETIGELAFERCSALKSVTLPDSTKTIVERAFGKCTSLQTVDFGENLESIGDNAFEECTSLKSLTFPNSPLKLGSYAFSKCSALETVDFGCGITEINNHAFYECKSLTDISLPDSVTSLGEGCAFENCEALKQVAIGEGLTKIPYFTFSGCDALETVIIGSKVEELERGAFVGCSSINKAYFLGNYPTAAMGNQDLFSASKIYFKQGAQGFSATDVIVPSSSVITVSVNTGVNKYTKYADGGLITQPKIPTRAGHVFTGWYSDTKCTVPFDFSKKQTQNKVTLYAGWDGDENIYDQPMGTKGDANDDGKITITDALEIFKHLAGKAMLSGTAFTCADVDENGNISITDALSIFKHLAGKELIK